MSTIPADTEPHSAWRRVRRYLECVRNWPVDSNSPYSPLFCVFLLLGVVLIIEVGN